MEAAKISAGMNVDEALSLINAEIIKSAEATYKALSERISADVRTQVSDHVTEQLRGTTFFEPGYGRVCDDREISGVKLMDDEYVIVYDSGIYSSLVTNYGRVKCAAVTKLEPKTKLTSELIDYIKSMRVGFSDSVLQTIVSIYVVRIIDKYNEKYALAHNVVHKTREDEIRADEHAKLADERAKSFAKLADESEKLDKIRANQAVYYNQLIKKRDDNTIQTELNEAQTNLLAADRRDFEAEVARDAANRKSDEDLKVAHKQAAIVRAQLARQSARLVKRENELAAEAKRLNALKRELENRAMSMSMNADDIIVGGSSEETVSDD